MKRTASMATIDDEEDDEASPVDGEELRKRLRTTASWGLRPGESLINIRNADELTDRSRPRTREDGTIMQGNRRIHLEEEEHGPSWSAEEFRRKDVINNDPYVGFLRLLAGCTHHELEEMFDQGSLHNQQVYAEELREWNKLERERLMVGSVEKKLQLDIVEARRESLKVEISAMAWSHRFLDILSNAMVFLLNPLLDTAPRFASLPLCRLLGEQYAITRDVFNILKPLVDGQNIVLNTPLRERFEKFFRPRLLKHPLADAFLDRAMQMQRDNRQWSRIQLQRFALLLYKYLYTRDVFEPNLLRVRRGTFNSDGYIESTELEATSVSQIFYETTQQLFFLYRKCQSITFHLLGFQGIQPGGELIDNSEPAKTYVGVDDIDYEHQKRILDEKLVEIRKKAASASKGSKNEEFENEIEKIYKELGQITKRRATRYNNLIKALETPPTPESFQQLFDSKSNIFQNDPVLSILHRALHGKNDNAPTIQKWFKSQVTGSLNVPAFLPRPSKDVKEMEVLYMVVANLAFLLGEFESTINDPPVAFDWDHYELTQGGRRFVIALLFFTPKVMFEKKDNNRYKLSIVGSLNGAINKFDELESFRIKSISLACTFTFKTNVSGWKKEFVDACVDWRNKLSESNPTFSQDEITKGLERFHGKYHAKLRETAFTTDTDLDYYNVVYFLKGLKSSWSISRDELTRLTYVNDFAPAFEHISLTLHDPLLSGCMTTLMSLTQNERITELFDANAFRDPLQDQTRFTLLTSEERAVVPFSRTTDFLRTLDGIATGVYLHRPDEKIDEYVAAGRAFQPLQLFSLQWHPSFEILLSVIAWVRQTYPVEKAKIDSQLSEVEKVISDAQAELYRLAMGGEASVKTQRDKVKDLYAPSAEWQMRPEFTGRITLAPVVVLALDRALAIVRTYVPSLRDATLDALMLCDADSGLPGAFAELVGALMNKTQLKWPQTYNKDIQYKIAPKECQNSLNALQGYTVRALPGGRYEATPPWSTRASAPSSSASMVSVFFM